MFKVLFSVIFSYILAGVRVPFRLVGLSLPDFEINDIQIDTPLAESPCTGCLKLPIYNSKDLLYFGQVYVGQNTTFKVMLDTGSNDLWLPAAKCRGCPMNKRYVCKNSKTCKMTKDAFSLQYFLGYVEGYKGYEMVGLTPDAQVNYPLVWINQGEDMKAYKSADGFIGLGNMEKAQDYIDLAYRNNYIKEKVFSFYLDHNSNPQNYSNSSYLTIGYLPEEKVNKLTWIPVTNPERWATKVKSIKIGSTIMDISQDPAAQEVVFDSGSAFLLLSGALINELKNQLKDLDQVGWGDVLYRCDSEYLENYPNMTVRVRNMTMILNVYSYLYFGQPHKESGKNYCQFAVMESPLGFLIFGASFFRNNFVTFSKRNQTIGIYQEYRPIVLPPAPPAPDMSNQVWIVIAVLVISVAWVVLATKAIDRMFISKKKEENNVKESLNQEQKNVETAQKTEAEREKTEM